MLTFNSVPLTNSTSRLLQLLPTACGVELQPGATDPTVSCASDGVVDIGWNILYFWTTDYKLEVGWVAVFASATMQVVTLQATYPLQQPPPTITFRATAWGQAD